MDNLMIVYRTRPAALSIIIGELYMATFRLFFKNFHAKSILYLTTSV